MEQNEHKTNDMLWDKEYLKKLYQMWAVMTYLFQEAAILNNQDEKELVEVFEIVKCSREQPDDQN